MHLSSLHLTAVFLAVALAVPTTTSGHGSAGGPEKIRGTRAAERRGEPGAPGGAGEPGEPNGSGGAGGYGGRGGDGGYIGPGDFYDNGWKDRNIASGGNGGHGGTGGNGNHGAVGGPGGIGGKGGDGGTIETGGIMWDGINIANGGHGGDGGFGGTGGHGGHGGDGGHGGNGGNIEDRGFIPGRINIANGGDGGTGGGRGGDAGSIRHSGNRENAVNTGKGGRGNNAGTGLKMDLPCLLLATIFLVVAHVMATKSSDLIAEEFNGQVQQQQIANGTSKQPRCSELGTITIMFERLQYPHVSTPT